VKKIEEMYHGMDIDWFAIDVDQNIALFASGGGILPATF